MSAASALEWYMLDLINAERTSRGLSELQLELNLNESSEVHSEWMLAVDVFSHTGSGGSSAGQRMDAAGFDFSGGWGWAENIAFQSIRGAAGYEDDVADLHEGLMNSSGHRANILNPNYEAIGIGVEIGEYNGFTVVMVTQNFAYTGGTLDLDSGGSGGGGTTPSDPTTGTSGDDVLSLSSAGELKGFAGNDDMTGSSSGDTLLGGLGEDTLRGGGGSDELDGGAQDDLIYGGSGDDFAAGGADNDTIIGSGGNDSLQGNSGNDMLSGGKANDTLDGGSGNDDVRGGAGQDRINGGSGDDDLYGGSGSDVFIFSSGDDTIHGFELAGNAERIDLSTSSRITSYNDLMQNHIRDVGGSAEIYDGLGNTLLVRGVSVSDFDSGEFFF